MRKYVHTKEKARLKSLFDAVAAMERVDKVAANRLRTSHALAERGYQERCRKAMEQHTRLPLNVGGYIAEYIPRTGQVVWMNHPNHMPGANALSVGKNGQRLIYGERGKAYSAARLCYAAVHGEVPEAYMVYCVNCDPADLRPTNLRSHVHRIMPDPDFRRRALEELAKIRASKAAS